jgi:hypothetical protein
MRRNRRPVLAECGESVQDLEPRSHTNLPGRGERPVSCASQMPREHPAGGGQRIHQSIPLTYTHAKRIAPVGQRPFHRTKPASLSRTGRRADRMGIAAKQATKAALPLAATVNTMDDRSPRVGDLQTPDHSPAVLGSSQRHELFGGQVVPSFELVIATMGRALLPVARSRGGDASPAAPREPDTRAGATDRAGPATSIGIMRGRLVYPTQPAADQPVLSSPRAALSRAGRRSEWRLRARS